MRSGCPQDGTARKVHRVILQRDGRGASPPRRVETKYELTNHEKLSGQNYNRARRDVEAGYSALADVALLGRDASRSGARGCADAIAKLDVYLSETEPGTPYREAIVAAKRILDPRQGNVTPGLLGEANGPLGNDPRSSGRNRDSSSRMSRSVISSSRDCAASRSFWYSSNRPAKRPISPLPSPRRWTGAMGGVRSCFPWPYSGTWRPP